MRGYMTSDTPQCCPGTLLFGYEWPPVPVESTSTGQARIAGEDPAPDPTNP